MALLIKSEATLTQAESLTVSKAQAFFFPTKAQANKGSRRHRAVNLNLGSGIGWQGQGSRAARSY